MGQNLLTTGATTLVSAVALVFPVGVGLGTFLITGALGSWRFVASAVVATLVLVVELVPIINWLGGVFEKTDVTEIAPGD